MHHLEQSLYDRAMMLENNAELCDEMKKWDLEFINDGLDGHVYSWNDDIFDQFS